MDPKYYALVEIVAFAVFAGGFCVYQIWSVRRKSDDDVKPPEPAAKPPDAERKI